jgi:hypothetical protein
VHKHTLIEIKTFCDLKSLQSTPDPMPGLAAALKKKLQSNSRQYWT